MKMENILLTAFIGTSSEILLRQITKYETLFLPNDKIRDWNIYRKKIGNLQILISMFREIQEVGKLRMILEYIIGTR